MDIQENYPLSNHTSFRIGGPATYFVTVTSSEELQSALNFAREKQSDILILGNGSNMLVSDQGFDGLVIHNKISGLTILDSGLVTVGVGENWDSVVNLTVEKGLAGIECLSGVPGSAGGALVQNIGAYGQTIGDVISEVNAVEIATGRTKSFSGNECDFKYRGSWFKSNPNKFIVTSFQFQLTPNGEPTVTYAHILKYFENKPKPALSELREFIIKIRGSKGYLIMPGYDGYKTAGSFFKNPVISQEKFKQLKPMLGDPALNRFWPTSNGVKIAAAYLMEEGGFHKGYREGKVGISPKHSLSLVNFGGASAGEVKALADKIKAVILEKFGVSLEEEVLYIGKFN